MGKGDGPTSASGDAASFRVHNPTQKPTETEQPKFATVTNNFQRGGAPVKTHYTESL